MGFKNLIIHMATVPATPHKGLVAQKHKDLPHFEIFMPLCLQAFMQDGRHGRAQTTDETYPTSLPPLQSAQCPSKRGRSLCLYASRPLCGVAGTVAICMIRFLKPIKNCFYVLFRNIYFFSRQFLSFFIPLQNVGDLYAPPCS